jgi:hypothetical protein
MGKLVWAEIEKKYHLALVVQDPGQDTARGVLLFPPSPGHATAPFFAYLDIVIELGDPEFVWSGNPEVLSGPYIDAPLPGHLVSTPEGLAISGRRTTGAGGDLYWLVKSGAYTLSRVHMGERHVFIREWRVGMRNFENKFHELATLPPTQVR